MFTRMLAVLARLQTRARILRARTILAYRWFLRQVRDVQIAVVVDLAIMFIAITAGLLFSSNKPARYALVPCFLIGLYIARKLALPIWFGELGANLADRAVELIDSWFDRFRSRLPWWSLWVVGQPGQTQAHATPPPSAGHSGEQQVVWHDTTVGAHMFHVLGTVWMWMHALLLACGIFPYWEQDWLSAIVMLTVFILFFVWTEDFVDIKKWRRRLGYAVTIVAVCYLSLMTLRVLMPGTYKNLMAQYWYHETLQDTEAGGVTAQTEDDRTELANLMNRDREFKRRYRAWQNSVPGATWTAADADAWASNTARLEELQTAAASGGDWASSGEEWVLTHFVLSLILIGVVVVLIPTKKSNKPSGH